MKGSAMWRRRLFFSFTLCLTVPQYASAQRYSLPPFSLQNPDALSSNLRTLAEQVEADYRDSDRDRYLSTLLRLQIAGGQYAEADSTITSLRELLGSNPSSERAEKLLPWQVYVHAKLSQVSSSDSFATAFKTSFQRFYSALDDKTSSESLKWFRPDVSSLEADLQRSLEEQKSQSLSQSAALDLIMKYEAYIVAKDMQPIMESVIAEDDARRYIIDDTVLVRTPDGASIATLIVRPRSGARALPTLLDFTIYANDHYSLNESRIAAAHGYVGAVAYTRGKGRSPDIPVPYEHDGGDAAAVIDWISKQPWSDGRVGMYGGSYDGFAQWAAAKHHPPGLKAMMPFVAAAPGIDVPMEGNIFLNFVYPYPFYTTDNKTLDTAIYNDQTRWDKLDHDWYISGAPYRSLDKIDGKPNPIFDHWLEHPDYDAYWQSMIPYRDDFAHIDIPVLATDGYLEGQGLSSLYYFAQHTKYDSHADHFYLIGPYTHIGAQHHPADVVDGYTIDPVAHIDIDQLRFQWFDYVFKNGSRPALLQDKVNYEVMGADEWKHAPSLEAMSNSTLRFHLTSVREGNHYQLADHKTAASFVSQNVDFADRSDADHQMTGLIVSKTLDTHNGIAYVSQAMKRPIEISGLFSGRLDIVTNKKDMDINVALYELKPNGEYFQLSYYLIRASYAKDRSRRVLLRPGEREQIAFRSERLTSCKFQAGSRLVVVISIVKQPDMQIDYGTGKDVSDESMADAKVPLEVRWFTDSAIDVPVWRK